MVNEALCYTQNNFSKHPCALLSTAVNGFYTDEEVSTAKHCIYGILEQMKPDGLPRFSRWLPGDTKRKLECDDILNFFAFVDGQEIILPVFAASKLDHLQTVSPGNVDVYALANCCWICHLMLALTVNYCSCSQTTSKCYRTTHPAESLQISGGIRWRPISRSYS